MPTKTDAAEAVRYRFPLRDPDSFDPGDLERHYAEQGITATVEQVPQEKRSVFVTTDAAVDDVLAAWTAYWPGPNASEPTLPELVRAILGNAAAQQRLRKWLRQQRDPDPV